MLILALKGVPYGNNVMRSFFSVQSDKDAVDKVKTQDHQVPSTSLALQSAANNVKSFACTEAMLKAEILYCLKLTHCHQSYRSCFGNNVIFKVMFPDCKIAKNFALSETKAKYLTCFGLAPFFSSLLSTLVKESSCFVILFDESLNSKLQKKQMYFHLRIWQGDQICTRYLTSEFVGHGTSADLKKKFGKILQTLPASNLLQISMDGPNVNWKMYENFATAFSNECNRSLLNIGSCGLHIVNGAFKDGAIAAGWKVDKILSSLYWLFKDTPARRGDFEKVNKTAEFPLKYCQHRWLENVSVAERALKLWPAISNYVEAAKKKEVSCPQKKSFDAIAEAVKDHLMLTKIEFFLSVAKQIQPFLLQYQTDKPMLPFISGDLFNLLIILFARFVKKDTAKQVGTDLYKLMKVDLDDKVNLALYDTIDLGFTAQDMVMTLKKAKKISDLQVMKK